MEYEYIITILFFRQFERVPRVLNRIHIGDMEYMDIYGVYIGQKGNLYLHS